MNVAQAAAGGPMTLRQEPSLSFGRIADAWAHETAGQVGALTRDEFLARLIAAHNAAEFESAANNGDLVLAPFGGGRDQRDDLTLWSSVPDPRTGEPGDWCHVDLRHRATVACIGVMSRIMAGQVDGTSAAGARIQLIEGSIISKSAFRAWAQSAGYALPRFWFSEAGIAERSETAVPTVKTKRNGGKKHGPYHPHMIKILENLLARKGAEYFSNDLKIITSEVRELFARLEKPGIALPGSRSGLEEPVRRWMKQRGL